MAEITIFDQSSVKYTFYWEDGKIVCDKDCSDVKKNLYLINYNVSHFDEQKLSAGNFFTLEILNNRFLCNHYPNDSGYKSFTRHGSGDLKLLSLEFFLRNKNNSIILIDEVENSLSTVRQKNLITLLNSLRGQYLLATHSDTLCKFLTPDHIKSLPQNPLSPVLFDLNSALRSLTRRN